MAEDVETEEVETEDEVESAADDSTDDGHSDDGGEGDEESQPFLAIDDRTVYKDADAAKQGWVNLKGQLDSYRKLGKPEEIANRLAEAKAQLDLIESIKKGTKGEQEKATKRYLDSLAPAKRREWEAARDPIREILAEELGEVKELKKEIADLKKSRDDERRQRADAELQRFRRRTMVALDRILEANGRGNLNDRQKKRLERAALAAIQDDGDEDGQELLQAVNAEDHERFALLAARNYLGEEAIKTTPNGSKNGAGDEKPRDPKTGQFLSEEQIQARKKAAAANKASRLPKAPPEGGSAGSEQGGRKKEPPPVHKRQGLMKAALDRIFSEQ